MSDTTINTLPAASGPSLIPQAPAAPTRPEYIPEKFWDAQGGKPKVDELAKAYINLEKRLGGQAPAPTQQTPSAIPTEATKAPDAPAESQGFDINALTAEYSNTGSLSEASIKALEAKGIPKPLVDSYIKGIQAQAEITLSGIFADKAELGEFKEWAAKKLPPEERAAFNSLIQGGDSNAIRLALQGLKVKFSESRSQDPELLGGDAAPSTGIGFPSWAHATAAMNDKRYHTDPAYRDEVQRRIANSPNLSN